MTETNISNKRHAPVLLCYLALTAGLVFLDQWSKALVLKTLSGGRIISVLPGILQFRYVGNTGAAFSVLSGKTMFLSVITIILLIGAAAFLVLDKVPGRWNQIAVVLMIAGGAGNLIDRLMRHFVVDFIEVLFTNFAVFNVADCCVTAGAVMLILSTLVSFWTDSRKEKNEE